MRTKTTALIVAAGLLAAAAIAPTAASGGSSDEPQARAAATRTVVLRNVRYNPSSIRIRRLDYVRWIWRDGNIRHDVKSYGPSTRRFRSSTLKRTGTHLVRFRRRGTFRYLCTIHPNMRGRVVVG